MRKLSLIICIIVLCLPASARKTRVASEFGIKGDGTTLNTEAIQSSIDYLSSHGGGVLKFTEGVYKTGCIVLKSDVEICIERGAVLSGSTNPEHYQSLIASEAKDNSTMALIVANDAKNIAITGTGLIDGNGRGLALAIDSLLNVPLLANPEGPGQRRRANEPLRPKLFFISNCDNVRVQDLDLRNSACWGLSLHSCRNVQIKGIDFYNRAYWNNDGIDVTDCKDVLISGCKIDSADDGICLKSYDINSCNENVTVENCAITSSASAVKFGTASWGGFKNITVRNISISDTFRSAVALECVDGGTLDNVLVENIHAVNTGNPIFIRLGQRAGDRPSEVRNIVIRNVFVEMAFGVPDIDHDLRGPGFSVNNPRPSSITGIPGQYVQNVRLENIEIVYPGRASKGIYYYPLEQIAQVPERVNSYPEFSMFGELPAWGFYVRHVQGLSMENVHLSLKDDDFRPAFVFDDAPDISLEKVSLPLLTSGSAYYAKSSSFSKNCLDNGGQTAGHLSKKELIDSFLDGSLDPSYTPAMYFGSYGHDRNKGDAAVMAHLEFFLKCDNDILKVQTDQQMPRVEELTMDTPLVPEDYYRPTVEIIKKVNDMVGKDVYVMPTILSPYQVARQGFTDQKLPTYAVEKPEAYKRMMESYTKAVLWFVRECKAAGIEAFFTASQGSEKMFYDLKVPGGFYETWVRPYDLIVMKEANIGTKLTIMHICDWEGAIDDLTRFLDYPGKIVSLPMNVDGVPFSLSEAYKMFGRPVIGGFSRLGEIGKSSPERIAEMAEDLIENGPKGHMILGADCSVPNPLKITDNVRAAVNVAHRR